MTKRQFVVMALAIGFALYFRELRKRGYPVDEWLSRQPTDPSTRG